MQHSVATAPTHVAAIDPRRWLAVLRRRWRVALLAAVPILAADLAYTLTAPPRYTAVARVLIDPRQPRVVEGQQVLSALPTDVAGIDTQVEVLRARALVERLAVRLHLERDPAFAGKPPRGKRPGDAHAEAAKAAAVDRLMAQVQVRRSGVTSVIDIRAVSASPQRAAEIANGLAALYLAEQRDSKFDATRQASGWLSERLAGLRTQVETAEAAVQRYRIDHGLLSADGTSLTEQGISGLNAQLAEARARQAEAQARLSTARSQLAGGSTGEDVGEALNSAVVGALRNQRSGISRTVADLEGRYGARHPELLKAQRELADIDAQIQAEVGRVLSNLEAQAQVARQRAASLQASLAGARGVLAGNNAAQVRLNELQRNAESARAIYQSYLDRFRQTTTQQGVEQADARILSPARPPAHPSAPRPLLNLTLGLVLAVGAGLGAAAARAAAEGGLSTAEEVERRTGLPWLGAVPLLSSTLNPVSARLVSPGQALVERPLSHFAESFRSLRTALVHARPDTTVQVVAVTSSLPGEGKTVTSMGLARTAALAGVAAVVVDCDLRRRSLNALFGSEPEAGLLEVLAGTATLDQALQRDRATGAAFLPLIRAAEPPKDVLGAPAMQALLAELRRRFALVVLDTAPVLAVADTRVLAARADAVLFLARWRRTPRPAVERSLRQLESVNAFIAGVALTQVDVQEQARTGYGDPGFYYRRYADYYVD